MTAIALPSVTTEIVQVTRIRGTSTVRPESSKDTHEAAAVLDVLQSVADIEAGKWTALDVENLEIDDTE